MKKLDSNEYYSSRDNSSFSEYKVFKAEEYYVQEAVDHKMEDFKVNEIASSFNDGKNESTSLSSNDLQKQLKEAENSQTAQTSTSSASSSSSTTASTSSSASTAATATGTAASTAATAAVVVTAIVSTSSIISLGIKEIAKKQGDNYISLRMDFDNFAEADEEYGIENRDYRLILKDKDGNEVMNYLAYEGEHEYLFPNLKNNSEYTAELTAFSNTATATSTYYSQAFKTEDYSAPAALFDEFKESFSFDYEYKTVTYNAGIYISDLQNDADGFFTILTSNGGTQDMCEEINEDDNFMYCSFNNIKGDSFKIQTYGIIEGQQELLLEKIVGVPFPEDWDSVTPKVALEATIDNIESSIGDIVVSGSCTEFFDPGDYSVKFTLHYGPTQADTVVDSYLDFVDDDHTQFRASIELPYGVKSYDVQITYEYNGSTFVVLDQKNNEYSVDQSVYGATLNTPSIKESDYVDMTYEYMSDSVEINVKTDFALNDPTVDIFDYDVYLILADNDEVYQSQTQSSSPYATFTNVEAGNAYYLRYELYGWFSDGRHLYQTIEDSSKIVDITKPLLEIGDELIPHDGHFDISYDATLPSNLTNCELQLSVYLDEEMDQVYHIDILNNPNGLAELTTLTAISGEVRIEYDLVFKFGYDSNSVINFGEKNYTIVNNIEILDLMIDIASNSASNSYIGEVNFSYLSADGYTVSIMNQDYSQIGSGDLKEKILFNGMDDTTSEITVIVYEASNEVASKIFSISYPDKNALEYNFSCVNPGEMILTYNDDGTINVYREVNFEDKNNANISYSASLVSDSSYDGSLSTYVPTYSYREFTTDNVSVIEDIPLAYASFLYELRVQPDLAKDIYYIFFKETPSGGIELDDPYYTYDPTETEGQYLLTIYSNGAMGDSLTIEGTPYVWDSYPSATEYMYQVTVTGEPAGKEVTVNYNPYYHDPTSITEKGITLKGSIYRETTFTIMV